MRTRSHWARLMGTLWLFVVGCGSSATNPDSGTPPAPGGSGAFGIVSIGGKQKMYLPQPYLFSATTNNGTVAVVDVGVTGNGVLGAPALITTIDLGAPYDVTATGGDSSVIIGVSTDNPHVFFIDPSTDKVTKMLTLDTNYGTSEFSGGGGYVTGVAVDSPNGKAYLSVWNGFAVVDLGSQTITSVIQVPPSENFGFDSTHHWLLAPFYDCSYSVDSTNMSSAFCPTYTDEAGAEMDNGLNIIDLADNNTVYTYQDPLAVDPTAPLGREPDSAAADPSTGKIVVPSEGAPITEYVVDLSQATFDKAKKTVTAPHVIIDGSHADELTGVAIEPSSHIAFFESEAGTDMGAANLTATTAAMSTYVHAYLPMLPDSTNWQNISDPHGIAVTTAMSGGHPVGFLVSNQYTWVARIDLTVLMGLPTTANPSVPTELDVADPSTAVTYLDATTKP
jgi:hypothetical protein